MAKIKTDRALLNSFLLLLAAIIWGISFVTQQIGGQLLGAYTFNSLRLLIGALVVYIAALILDKAGYSQKPANKAENKRLWLTGLGCGVFLAIGTNLQQLALNSGVSTGKAGFLTTMYILIVPIISLFFGSRCGWNVWVGALIAAIGMYFLCMSGSFSLETPDLLLLGGSLGFACQIVVIDRYGGQVDSLRLSCVQFLISGVLSLIPALIFEMIPFAGGLTAWLVQFASGKIWISLLYMGIASCGVGYTLQIIGQKGVNPTVASLIMSLESVFALLAGLVFLKQLLSGREIFGCCLMFIAICLAQINFKRRKQA
ncbi:MAG: DMT family transporter [Lachnospiraceae bacterium]|jgi:drug/metabolite transporter (DMT)-like permease